MGLRWVPASSLLWPARSQHNPCMLCLKGCGRMCMCTAPPKFSLLALPTPTGTALSFLVCPAAVSLPVRLSVPLEWERQHALRTSGGGGGGGDGPGGVRPLAPVRRTSSSDNVGAPFASSMIPDGSRSAHSPTPAASRYANSSLENLSSSSMQSLGAVQQQQALLYALAQAQQQTALLHEALRRSDNGSSHTGSLEAGSSLHSTTSDTIAPHPGASMAGEQVQGWAEVG